MNLVAPLDGLNLSSRAAALQGGYEYLQWTGEAYHPGLDLNAGAGGNADCGRLLIATRPGVIRFTGYHVTSTGRGFGNHLWHETDTEHHLHYCHADWLNVRQGQHVEQGDVLGGCGRTAGWDLCHLHFEVRDTPPADWNQWVAGWGYAAVAREYRDPYAWLLQYAVEGLPPDMTITPEQQRILDAAARNGLDDAGIDNVMGINRLLGEQKTSLEELLRTSQAETAAQAAEAERLRALVTGQEPAKAIKNVAVMFADDRVEVLTPS